MAEDEEFKTFIKILKKGIPIEATTSTGRHIHGTYRAWSPGPEFLVKAYRICKTTWKTLALEEKLTGLEAFYIFDLLRKATLLDLKKDGIIVTHQFEAPPETIEKKLEEQERDAG